ncbi:MAG: S-layer homology domain-containing protein [Peptoniphilus harei]|uniref:S-layer homology domain-containing protein n=1 Tax=Peptoniphilus harei TaxID=54005 RepID=UPI0029148FB0|nr:S-layer homology domain-containing protein [Peptoniphilus harei]MDU5471200.1 S-layer homology domain-containing protein [Peptoniphilus harei]MDU6099006.1 S-layer homology domain-containing protein [Peptoniphilus harei]
MKPYSKKYLTLALAGVLAASIPVSAFATGEESDTKPGGENQPAVTDTTTNNEKTEAEKAKEEAEKAKKEAEKAKEEAQKAKEEADRLRKEKEEKEEKEKKDQENKRKYRRITLNNVRYDGKYIKGETSAYAEIYVQDNYYKEFRNKKRIGEADKNGEFSIKYDIKEGKSVTIYAENDYGYSKDVEVKNDNYKDIKGSKIAATDLRLMGRTLTGFIKNHPFENIRVYRDGELLGSFRTDKNSYFTVVLSENLRERDLDDLRFYTDKKEVENKKFKITEALEGQKLVKGTANTDDEITVYDASGKKISNTYVNNAGVFTAFLDRALIYGETIKIEAKDKDKNITKIEYKVTKNAVEEVKAISYIKGYPDGTFKPQANVTRAEAAQMFATLLNGGTNFGTSGATKFSDASDDWYSKAVNYVVGKGLISGYPNGTFKPNDSITRAEFAQMISGYIKNEKAGSSDFQDVKDHWAKDAIDKLYGNKNVTGYPDGSFKPNAKITRAEAVTILNSVFNRNTNKNSLNNVNTSSLNKFSDVNESFWAYYNILDAANTHDRERLNSTSEVDMWK